MTDAPPRMTALDGGTVDGIQWATCRAPLYGAINGYVRIPEGHPWHGLDYDDIDVAAHGGLTFAADGWIGFDTLHLGDLWPGEDQPHFCRSDSECGCIYWDAEMVADEARALAARVAAAGA